MLLNALSSSIEDEFQGTEQEVPVFSGEKDLPNPLMWQACLVKILLPEETDKDCFLQELQTSANILLDNYYWELLADRDWVKEGRKGIDIINLDNKLKIVPPWKDYTADNIPAIFMEPGLAFGSGNHPTTYLCLNWLVNFPLTGQKVLDYGTGSGILALAAKKFGAKEVVGVDTDPLSIQAAADNADKNSLDISLFLPEDFQNDSYDLVLANILLTPLIQLAPILISNIKNGGTIILSGILENQVENIKEVYSGELRFKDLIIKDGWALIVGEK